MATRKTEDAITVAIRWFITAEAPSAHDADDIIAAIVAAEETATTDDDRRLRRHQLAAMVAINEERAS